MTDEVRKAAERLRRYRAGESWATVWVDDCDLTLAEQREDDRRILANAYLSEHPADDDELVTEEWWRTVADNGGLHLIITDEFLLYYGQEGRYYGMVLSAEGNERPCDMYSVYMPHIRTRSDVRRLCRALGIELKEQAG